MKLPANCRLFAQLACAGLAVFACTQVAHAQIVLSQPKFEGGQNYAAFFRVEHGCGGSPTLALKVHIPEGVTVLQTPDKPGWKLETQRVKDSLTDIIWRGRLDAGTTDQFGLFLKLPAKAGTLYFPAVQQCEKGEMRWTDIPAAGQSSRDVTHPAPTLQLTAATSPTTVMAGNMMIGSVWSPATPGGATTGAVYATIMNHGNQPDTLIGGSTPIAGKFEIHQTTRSNGVVSMRPISTGIPVPAGGMVTLGPQGDYHVMLSGLKEALKTGTRVPATLNFAKAGAVRVEITVEPVGSRGPSGAMPGMDHH